MVSVMTRFARPAGRATRVGPRLLSGVTSLAVNLSRVTQSALRIHDAKKTDRCTVVLLRETVRHASHFNLQPIIRPPVSRVNMCQHMTQVRPPVPVMDYATLRICPG